MSSIGGIDRPLGVAILSVVSIIAGILDAILGVIVGVAGAWLSTVLGTSITDPSAIGIPWLGFFAGLVVAVAAIFVILGIVSIVVGWGLWGGKDWARILGLVLSGLGAILGLLSLFGSPLGGIIILAINVIIIYYLTRPNVAAFFGRRVERAPPAAATPI